MTDIRVKSPINSLRRDISVVAFIRNVFGIKIGPGQSFKDKVKSLSRIHGISDKTVKAFFRSYSKHKTLDEIYEKMMSDTEEQKNRPSNLSAPDALRAREVFTEGRT